MQCICFKIQKLHYKLVAHQQKTVIHKTTTFKNCGEDGLWGLDKCLTLSFCHS